MDQNAVNQALEDAITLRDQAVGLCDALRASGHWGGLVTGLWTAAETCRRSVNTAYAVKTDENGGNDDEQ